MTTPSSWVEIACDESGFSGTNLLDSASPVLTHASVDLTEPEAAAILAVLRPEVDREPEYKASRLLRAEQRPALAWFVGALQGRSHVVVIDKRGFVAARVVELFVDEPSYGAGTRLGPDHAPAVRVLRTRTELLAAFVDLCRARRRPVDRAAIDRFVATIPTDVPALREATPARVEEVLVRLVDGDPAYPPPLEPLVPALAETLLFWSAGRRSVAVVHDEQSALTPGRVAHVGDFLAREASPAPPPLRSFRQVDSKDDARVQVADLLAGVARNRASGGAPGPPCVTPSACLPW